MKYLKSKGQGFKEAIYGTRKGGISRTTEKTYVVQKKGAMKEPRSENVLHGKKKGFGWGMTKAGREEDCYVEGSRIPGG